MAESFNLENYLTKGVEHIVKNAIKATLKNPKESLFLAKYVKASKEASRRRKESEDKGEHIPPFLIASITSKCNLHCAGCYARSNKSCMDHRAVNQLTDVEWEKIFTEAKEMGVGFILLAGGEPLMRQDVIMAAGKIPEIIFPIFTNGTMIDKSYIDIFDKYRNLLPVLSIEGEEAATDQRRGEGVYNKLISVMEEMMKKHIFFGVSITVTKENMEEVTNKKFLDILCKQGCKLVFYIEYVPISKENKELAFGEEEREYLMNSLSFLRNDYEDMVFISFPGDEKSSGGCLAAGRGFFHINSHGGAEPCPFSPYSDINVRDTSVREALKSKLFTKLKENNLLLEDHTGGCVLFEKQDIVESLIQN